MSKEKKYINALLYLKILLFFGLNPFCSFSQSLFFDRLTIKEGLPHNTVYSVTQDHDGFIWLATHSGLVRYDGYTFLPFPKVKDKKNQEIAIKTVQSLLIDSKGKLWIGTETDGVILHDLANGEWLQVVDNQKINSVINSVFEDKKGNFWIATMNDGCLVLDANYQIIQHFNTQNSILQSNSVFSFAEDNNGRVWVAGAGSGINYYNAEQNKLEVVHNQLSPNEDLACFRKCLFWDKKNRLWIGTESDGLYLYQTQNQSFQHFKRNAANGLFSNAISDIKEMPDGKIWLSTDGNGLLICEPNSLAFLQESHHIDFYNGLNTNNLLKIFIDKDANVWFATFNGGVNIWKKYKTHFPNHKEWTKTNFEFSDRSILGIQPTKSGKIWFASDGGGINVWDKNKQKWSVFQHKSGSANFPSSNVPKSIFEDNKGNIWVGYFNGGLDFYNPLTGQYKHFQREENNPNSLSDNNVWSIAEDNKGNIWLGTLGGGLNKYDVQNNIFTRFLHQNNNQNSIADNGIFIICYDEGKIWVGTKNSGLDHLDIESGTFSHFYKGKNADGISGNDIRSIFKDHNGKLWVGTESAGLNKYLGNGKFQKYTTSEGLFSNAIMSIVEDNRGMLWLGSFQGLTRFDSEKSQFFNYDFHLSNISNQFNHLAAAKLSDGTLCFGGIDGVNFINPNQLAENTIHPTVFLSDFKVFNQSIVANDSSNILKKALTQTKEIHLSYTQNLFSFDFSALEYTSPQDVRYAFLLEGFDNDWRFTNEKEHSVTYTKLNSGTYFFKVYATNSSGVWSDKITEIKVIIHPPFWKTWWFRCLMMVLLIAFLRWLFKEYTQRREEKWRTAVVEQEKEILRLQNENLGKEIEGKTTELMSKALQMGHKNEVMQKLKDGLKSLREDQSENGLKKLRTLENLVNIEMQNEDNWKQFNIYFDQVNHNFTDSLLKKFPHLTPNDIRVCILIKLNLSIKEMAALLNISTQGVEKSKYRLKKRLNLSAEDDLTEFLRKV